MFHRISRTDTSLRPGPITLELPATDDLGGLGLFSTAEDYALLLAALVSDGHPLLRMETVDVLFEPQVCTAARGDLFTGLGKQMRRLLGVESLADMDKIDHSLAGTLTMEDLPGRRRAGSASWAGLPNLHWVYHSSQEKLFFLLTIL